MASDPQRLDRFREALLRIDPNSDYYALTLTAERDDKITWAWQSEWVGTGYKAMWELRAPALVDPKRMKSLWSSLGEPPIVVNDLPCFGVFLRLGGNALIERTIGETQLPDLFEPIECVPGPLLGGPRRRETVSKSAFNRAPTKRLRMDVLKRDGYRCLVCGRRASDHVDIELHVHHVRPYARGGLTEADNLMTLCNTCHRGLDPHFEMQLLELFPGGPPAVPIDITIDQVNYKEGVQRYRQVSEAVLYKLRK